jgi:hypothetical protein
VGLHPAGRQQRQRHDRLGEGRLDGCFGCLRLAGHGGRAGPGHRAAPQPVRSKCHPGVPRLGLGTGADIGLQDPSDGQIDQLGDRAAAFYASLGADFDLAFSEISDRDSGFDQVKYGIGPEAWWNDADFTRHARFIGRFVQGSGKRIVLWQAPLGTTKMRAMNNTDFHFQDNRVEKLLDEPSRARLQTYVNAGVMAFLFGSGEYLATHPTDYQGTGVTNPDPINGNTTDSYNADDDGGYFHNRVAAYYTAGVMSIPSGSSSPVTPTPTVTPNSRDDHRDGGTRANIDSNPDSHANRYATRCDVYSAAGRDGGHNCEWQQPSGGSRCNGPAQPVADAPVQPDLECAGGRGGQTGRTGAFSVSLPGNTTSTSFYVRRATAGAATAMLTVVDRCGSWSTFVGGGAGGGF